MTKKIRLVDPGLTALGTSGGTSEGIVQDQPLVRGAKGARTPGTKTPVKPKSTATETPGPAIGGSPPDWQVILDSDFSTNDPGSWLTGDASGSSIAVANGTLNMTATGQVMILSWPTEAQSLGDAFISATVTLKGPGLTGVMGRYTRDENGKGNRVVCTIDNNAAYGCYTQKAGEWTDVGSGDSSVIKPNSPNVLGLLVVGENASFMINGKQIVSFPISGVDKGSWGLLVQSENDGDTSIATISHVTISGPAGSVQPTPTEIVEQPTSESTPETSTTAAPPSGNVILDSDFTDAGNWQTRDDDSASIDVQNGELVVKEKLAGAILVDTAEELLDIDDGTITAKFRVDDASSPGTPGYVGVIARSQVFSSTGHDWSQIICAINPKRHLYLCLSMDPTAQKSIMRAHGSSGAIKANQPNTLTLSAQGSKWVLTVNGQKLGTFSDNTVKSGAWGVVVGSGDKSTTGYFDRITVTQP